MDLRKVQLSRRVFGLENEAFMDASCILMDNWDSGVDLEL